MRPLTGDGDWQPPKVAIVVPRRHHPFRDAVWSFLKPRWETFELSSQPVPIFEVYHEEGLFNRAWCINQGAEQAGDWDVMLIIDSDVYVPHSQVFAAIERAYEKDQMTLAFDERYALSQTATLQAMDGKATSTWRKLPLEDKCSLDPGWHERNGFGYPCRMSNHNSNSHCVAMPRQLWDEMGGFDERFEGWGFEDMAVLAYVKTFRGEPERVGGWCAHFYHPRSQEREWGHPNYGVNEALGMRYFEAEGDPEAIKKVLAERPLASLTQTVPSVA